MTKSNLEPYQKFKPHPWQVPAWRDISHTLLFTGSAGGGKSRLAAEKIHGYCLKYPGAMALMLRKTRESMTNSTVLFMDRAIIGRDKRVRHYPSKNRFEYTNGSILVYGGMANDDQREQIRSIGQDGSVDICWMEEAAKFTESDFNEILARMRGRSAPWRQVILSTNPDVPAHWIYKRLLQGGEAKVYLSGAHDNPNNAPDYLETLDKLTGVIRDRLRDGLWVQAEGVVYPQYDPTLHLIDSFSVPADWRRIRSIDFGYTNPFVCQWWAICPDGRMYLYREIYMSQMLIGEAADEINERSEGERYETSVADHDAGDRATLAAKGIHTTPAKKDVRVGLQKVAARLERAGDEWPRLYIMRGALTTTDRRRAAAKETLCTEDEIAGYVWQRTADGRPVKEEPVKVNDHGMDAMRYAVMYVDRGVRANVRYL